MKNLNVGLVGWIVPPLPPISCLGGGEPQGSGRGYQPVLPLAPWLGPCCVWKACLLTEVTCQGVAPLTPLDGVTLEAHLFYPRPPSSLCPWRQWSFEKNRVFFRLIDRRGRYLAPRIYTVVGERDEEDLDWNVEHIFISSYNVKLNMTEKLLNNFQAHWSYICFCRLAWEFISM